MISSLPGKALRMLVDIVRLAERFNMHSRSRGIKRHEPGNLFMFTHCFTLQNRGNGVIFDICVDSA